MSASAAQVGAVRLRFSEGWNTMFPISPSGVGNCVGQPNEKGNQTMFRFKRSHLALMLGLIAPVPAFATNFCIAVNGGFGSGGTSFVGPGFVVPTANLCEAWLGFTKTATSVIATATGTGCVSSNGKVLTLSIFDTDPPFLGAGTAVSDYIQLCPKGVTSCPISGSDQGYFAGTAAEQTCTAALLRLPVTHD
jgi:hypothetical protein